MPSTAPVSPSPHLYSLRTTYLNWHRSKLFMTSYFRDVGNTSERIDHIPLQNKFKWSPTYKPSAGVVFQFTAPYPRKRKVQDVLKHKTFISFVWEKQLINLSHQNFNKALKEWNEEKWDMRTINLSNQILFKNHDFIQFKRCDIRHFNISVKTMTFLAKIYYLITKSKMNLF